METFQAKDILRILNIQRHRLDYCQARLRIEPDHEKAERRGQTSLFTFKGLMQIAFASTAVDLGMQPDNIVLALQKIQTADEKYHWGLFDPKFPNVGIAFHYIIKNKIRAYVFTMDEEIVEYIFIDRFWENQAPQNIVDALKDGLNDIITDEDFQKTHGYITLNLSSIKETVVKKI